jgi:inosose dehydratase
MKDALNRRDFIQYLGLMAGGTLLSLDAEAKKAGIRMGYSAITWGGKDDVAIREIASLGFPGIQLRANTFGPYRNKVSELKAMLEAANLQLVMFSSGNVEVDPAKRQSTIDQHVAHASFVKALGGSALQLTNSLRKNNVAPTTEQLKELTAVMNEIGKQTADLGVQAVYHNHMAQWGETPEEVDVIVNEMNPKSLRLLLDIAHYHQGGGNPAEAVLKYKPMIHSLHIKDTRSPLPDKPNDPKAYKFVELGQGRVNITEVFDNLRKIKFGGWAIVELDGVPDTGKTPLSCAETSKKFLVEKAKVKL